MSHGQRPARDAEPSAVRRAVAMLATGQALAMTGDVPHRDGVRPGG